MRRKRIEKEKQLSEAAFGVTRNWFTIPTLHVLQKYFSFVECGFYCSMDIFLRLSLGKKKNQKLATPRELLRRLVMQLIFKETPCDCDIATTTMKIYIKSLLFSLTHIYATDDENFIVNFSSCFRERTKRCDDDERIMSVKIARNFCFKIRERKTFLKQTR